MRIDIVGGGAIGLSWAARLAGAGAAVRIWTRTAGQADALNGGGLVWRRGETERRAAVEARPADPKAASAAGGADGGDASRGAGAGAAESEAAEDGGRWIVLAVKSFHLDEPDMLPFVAALAGEGQDAAPVVCLQNGIGHMEKLRAAMPLVPLAQAVTTEGALREGPATVRLTGEGVVRIEELPDEVRGRSQKMFVDMLNKAGIPALLSKKIMQSVYGKLLINAVVNPLTALYGVRNGELPADSVRLALMRAAHDETLAALTASGFEPDGGEWDRLLDVCKRTADNRSSMLADVLAGRPTEAGAINGGVAGLARRAGIGAPLNEALAELVDAIAAKRAADAGGAGEAGGRDARTGQSGRIRRASSRGGSGSVGLD